MAIGTFVLLHTDADGNSTILNAWEGESVLERQAAPPFLCSNEPYKSKGCYCVRFGQNEYPVWCPTTQQTAD